MKRNIPLLYAVRFVANLHFLGGVLIPFFTEWGNLPQAVIPQIQLWFMWWSAILEVPTGVVADKYGRKTSVILGLLCSSLGFAVYVIKPHLGFFLLGEFIIALGFALISGADEALLYDTLLSLGSETKATQTFAQISNVGMVGYLLGAPIGSVLAVMVGYPFVYLSTAVSILFAAVVAVLLVEPPVSRLIAYDLGYKAVLNRGIRLFWQFPEVRSLGLDYAIVGALAGTIIWFNQMILGEVNFPIAWFGTVASAGIATEILFAHSVGRLERRFGFELVARVSAIIPVFGFTTAVIGILSQSWVLAVLSILAGFLVIIGRKSLIRAKINGYIPSSERSTALSAVELVRKFMIGLSYIVMSVTLSHSLVLSLIVIGSLLMMYNVLVYFWRVK